MTELKKRKHYLTNNEKDKIFNEIQTETSKLGLQGKQLQVMTGELIRRAALATYLGKSYSGNRDLYSALGYVVAPDFMEYYSRYQRQDIATRVVKAPVTACWKNKPVISEGVDEETKFEKEWSKLAKDNNIYHYLSRADKLARIGRYGVMYLGFDKAADEPLTTPVTKATKLLYMRVYTQSSASIETYEKDTTNERYGLPTIYKLTTSTGSTEASQSSSISVHHSRVIHVAEDLEENEYMGTPALQSILNRLFDLELVLGGSAEMFWRGAFPGMAFLAKEDADFEPQEKAAMEDQIYKYIHSMERHFRMKGIDIKELSPQVTSPKDQIDVIIDIIAGATGIPKRLLVGSERGELASSQDENNWNSRVDERRKDHCERMLRALVDRLMEVGILSSVEEYNVIWPILLSQSAEEQAKIADLKMSALQKYMSSRMTGQDVLPVKIFLRSILNFEDDEITEIEDLLEGQFDDDQDDLVNPGDKELDEAV